MRRISTTTMSLDLDLTFPIRDAPSADLMRLKATCLWNAGIIDAGERSLFSNGLNGFCGERKQAPRCGHRQAAAWQDQAHGQCRRILPQSPPIRTSSRSLSALRIGG